VDDQSLATRWERSLVRGVDRQRANQHFRDRVDAGPELAERTVAAEPGSAGERSWVSNNGRSGVTSVSGAVGPAGPRLGGWGGQVVAGQGGPQAVVNSWVQASCQGQPVGRPGRTRRAASASCALSPVSVAGEQLALAGRNTVRVELADPAHDQPCGDLLSSGMEGGRGGTGSRRHQTRRCSVRS